MEVSPVCLGAMMLGAWGNRDRDECVRVVHRALDAGINFIDTADVYSAGESEEIVGRALEGGRRDDVILATKCHFNVELGAFSKDRPPNSWGNSRRHIIRACEASLRRLGTDWIDLYQVHRPDAHVPLEETLLVLDDLVHQGKIRAFGCSTFPADLLMEAAWVADRRTTMGFASEQPPYSIFVRWAERDVFPVTRRLGMGTLVWSPLNGGWLSGAYRRGMEARTEGRAARQPGRFDPGDPVNQRRLDLVEALIPLADACGVSLARFAIAWTLQHPAVTSAIIGPRTVEHLDALLGADEVHLPSEILDRVDELVPPGACVLADEAKWERPELVRRSLRRRS
jgi:aryl-alcohol dehydrogenase-like predicted oxidoreductase